MVILVSFQLILLINKRKKLRISTFTTMTNPDERNDPWKEALSCYESFSDEVVVVGNDWPKEFKFDLDVIPLADFSANQTQGCRDFTVTLSNSSDSLSTFLWDFGNGDTNSVIFSPVITYSDTGTFEIYLYVTDSVCQLTDTALITITVLDSISIDLVDTMSFCAADSLVFNPIVTGSPDMFVWSSVKQIS